MNEGFNPKQPNVSEQKPVSTEENIEQILSEAQSSAVDSVELNEMFQRKIRMLNQPPAQFLKNLDEFNKLDEEIKKHIIIVKTLMEYKALLQKIAPSDVLYDTLAHENAHANKAESLGVNLNGYAVVVSKNKDGFVYQPYVDYTVPTSWDRKREIETNIEIADAPREYGNRLAPDDAERVEELKSQLKKLYGEK